MANMTGDTSLPLLEGRVSVTTFRVAILVTFSFAIFAATCRLVALAHQRKRIGLDDIFLILATIFLIAGTTILLIQVETMYFVESIDLNGLPIGYDAEGLTDKIDRFQKLRWSFLAVSWSSIFFVKFSFLAFFSGLCDRMPKMDLYRKALYGLCAVTFIYLVLNGIVTCPQDGDKIIQCTSVDALQKNMAMGIVAIALDVFTDLTIVSIPMVLLWKVKLRPYQKLVIGVALCLSIVMIVLAITRMIGFRYHGVIDNSWIYLWQHVEASAAVIMISLTAFRSVFTSKTMKYNPRNIPRSQFFGNRRAASDSTQDLHLNGISSVEGIMAGTRTTIERGTIKDDVDFAGQPGTAITTDYIVHGERTLQRPSQALLEA